MTTALSARPARVPIAWVGDRYVAVAVTALRQSLSERATVLGRVLLYAMLLLIFSQLWEVVRARGGVDEARASDMLWYLAATEWIVLSLPLMHLEIEADIRNGDVATRLPRPMSYLGARLAEAAGAWILRASTLGLAGVVMAFLFSGGWPSDPRGLALVLTLGVLGSILGVLWIAMIGLAAFWIYDSSPLYWVWQKFAFIFGGLMLPLEFYPEWLQDIATWTPFAPMMHGPAQMVFGPDLEVASAVLIRLVVWIALSACLLAWTYRRALRALDVGGG